MTAKIECNNMAYVAHSETLVRSFCFIEGKMEAVQDIALFAMESHSSPLVTLTPESHASAIDSGDEWLIDYYAPVSFMFCAFISS